VIAQCAAQMADIRTFFVDEMLTNLHQSYMQRVQAELEKRAGDKNKEGLSEVSEPVLLRWLTDYYPPVMLRKMHVTRVRQIGPQYVSSQTRRVVTEWLRSMRAMRVVTGTWTGPIRAFDAVAADLLELLSRSGVPSAHAPASNCHLM